jgi:hypothetical protein
MNTLPKKISINIVGAKHPNIAKHYTKSIIGKDSTLVHDSFMTFVEDFVKITNENHEYLDLLNLLYSRQEKLEHENAQLDLANKILENKINIIKETVE